MLYTFYMQNVVYPLYLKRTGENNGHFISII